MVIDPSTIATIGAIAALPPGTLTRLVEVLAEGVGGFWRPAGIYFNAYATGKAIDSLGQAIQRNPQALITYEADGLKIESPKLAEIAPSILADNDPAQVLAYRELKKQANTINVAQYAADELKDNDKAPDEKPDSDWIASFFRHTETVTTEKMQRLWGKLLAGEIMRPGSYSMRTLEVLKNLTSAEAALISRVASLALRFGHDLFLLRDGKKQNSGDQSVITLSDLFIMRELNLVLDADNLRYTINLAPTNRSVFFHRGRVLIATATEEKKCNLDVYRYTKTGRELFGLVEQPPFDKELIRSLCAPLMVQGTQLEHGPYVPINDEMVQYSDKLFEKFYP